jgi:amino acid adenylation domain-containing protein
MIRPLKSTGNSSLVTPREAVLQYQRRLFQELLRKVWRDSAFYRDYYGGHGIREGELADVTIRDLPYLSKKILMANFDGAVTDTRLRKQDLERWLDEIRDPREAFRRNFIVMHSSGSSGTTGIFVYSRTDWQVMNTIMAARLPQPENHPAGRTRVAFYRAAHGHFAGVATAVHLPKSVYDTLIVSLLDPAEYVIEQLQRFQPHRLTGYSSSIALLAEQAMEGKLRIHPQTIFVSGDLLTQSMEQRIQEAWGAPTCNLYGASESLFLAVKEAGHEEMTVMDDLNVLEILDEQNRPVEPGEEGRLVVTNLYNYTLPVLRYELVDYVTRGTAPSAAGFSSIQGIRPGKANDALPIVQDSGAHDTISPRALTSFYAAGLERAQFISQQHQVRIDYVARHNIDDEVRKEFQRILDLKGASRMTFEVRRVSAIGTDPQTGKVRLVKLEEVQMRQPSRIIVNDAPPGGSQECRVVSRHTFVAFKKAEIEQSIPGRFEQQVEKYPNRLAVKNSDHALSYEALNRAANRVAQAIVAQRGKGEEPIALLAEQGIPALVTILGVLKAGKFYVPLDPTYPPARLAAVVEDCQASLIVTNNTHLASAMAFTRDARHVLNIDALDSSLSDRNPGLSISPDTLAYLFYTSGSTGQPKGVVQNHRNVLHQIMTYTNGLRLCADDRVTLLHSHGFSASRLDIFGALLNGAALFPFSFAEEGMASLTRWLLEQEMTLFHWVPTAFRHFVDTLSGTVEFPKLRLIVLGSEPVSPRDVELYKTHFAPGCVLVNRFGTTETGNVRWYFIDKQTQIPSGVVPVGYAMEDTEVLLLDETGKKVEDNQIGEIAIRSRYLSPGYWRRPELTRAVFLMHPDATDKTIYRTGDMGYMLPDGCLVHAGRKDFQAKIRGHRVEPGDIERALLEHTAVREAAVVVRDGTDEEKRLVAYVVVAGEPAPTGSALRSFLEARLPGYMAPKAFVQLEALPLTPSGKVDRPALPEPDNIRPDVDTQLADPRTPVEKTLTQIWSDVLGVARVGIHDGFFDLGGHSLLAGKIISRVADTFKVEIPFRDFFELPTVAHVAEIIRREKAKKVGDRELAGILTELESLSDEEARKFLEDDSK